MLSVQFLPEVVRRSVIYRDYINLHYKVARKLMTKLSWLSLGIKAF